MKQTTILFLMIFFVLFNMNTLYGQAITINSSGNIGIRGPVMKYIPRHPYYNTCIHGNTYTSGLFQAFGDITTGHNIYVAQNCNVGKRCGINGMWSNNYTLKVQGEAYFSGSIYGPSDLRLKKNIKKLNGNSVLSKLKQIECKEYEFKNREELISLNGKNGITFYNDSTRAISLNDSSNFLIHKPKIKVPKYPKGKQYGILAQEVEEVFPEVISFDSTEGTYGINYIAFIPMLIEAVKEQDAKISNLEVELRRLKRNINNNKSAEVNSSRSDYIITSEAILYQNIPNPFNKETRIECFIPVGSEQSVINIYDLTGSLVSSHPIEEIGNTSPINTRGAFCTCLPLPPHPYVK